MKSYITGKGGRRTKGRREGGRYPVWVYGLKTPRTALERSSLPKQETYWPHYHSQSPKSKTNSTSTNCWETLTWLEQQSPPVSNQEAVLQEATLGRIKYPLYFSINRSHVRSSKYTCLSSLGRSWQEKGNLNLITTLLPVVTRHLIDSWKLQQRRFPKMYYPIVGKTAYRFSGLSLGHSDVCLNASRSDHQ